MNKIFAIIYQKYKDTPNDIAIIDENGTFTWRELVNFSYCIAHALQSLKIKQNDVVSIELANSREFIASIFACQILGAIYVPLSNLYPADRVKYIRHDCRVKVSIDSSFIHKLDLNNIKPIDPVTKNSNEVEMIIYTSGSTGKPKGVIHSGLSLFYAVIGMHNRYTDILDNDRLAIIAPLNFILGIQGALGVLTGEANNVSLALMTPATFTNPGIFISLLKKWHVNKIAMGASLMPVLKNQDTYIKKIYIGGERVQNAYLDKFKTFNSYGASELGGGVFFFPIDKNYSSTPIGEIFPHLTYYILNEHNEEVDYGELCIAGEIALGYLNLPEETKKAFIDNPFYKRDGYKRMFRTGDIAQRDKAGNISIVGRKDLMIKVNGQRVEIEEIEYAIKQTSLVRDVAVKYFSNNSYLVAFYTSDNDVNIDDLKKRLKASLSTYMIPSFFVRLEKLPILMNGKINRFALPDFNPLSNQIPYVAPRNEIEKDVCDAFANIFHLKRVGINDNFFALGGDSLSAIRLLDILKKYVLLFSDVNNLKTPKLISEKISSRLVTKIDINKYTLTSGAPLSEQQLNVYLDVAMNKKGDSYLIPLKIKLDKYPIPNIISAVNEMINIHPILKGYIDESENDPFIKIGKKPIIKVVDNIDDDQIEKFLSTPFAINKELSRFLFNKKDKTLYVVFHHLISDGASTIIFAKHLLALLNNESVDFDQAFLQFSALSEEIKKTKLFKDAELFFEKEFIESENIIELLPDIGTNNSGYHTLKLDINSARLSEFVKKYEISKNDLFTSVFAYTISRFTNTSNAYFAIIEEGRDRLDAGNSIGMFVSTLPILIDCSDDTIANFLTKSRNKIYQTINYDFYPFRLLKNKYNVTNNIQFQYLLDLKSRYLEIYEKEQRKDLISDLSFDLYESNDVYTLCVTNSAKYSSATVKKILLTYNRVLNEIMLKDRLKDINYTLDEDLSVFNKINATSTKLVYHDILEAFNNSLKKYPNNTLVTYLDNKYTYKEGAKWINNLTNKLNNIPQGSNIAILTHRSHYYLLTALAVLNHGSTYVPIDDAFPDSRVDFMINDTNALAIIVTNETINRVKAIVKNYKKPPIIINASEVSATGLAKPLATNFDLDSVGLILYTSGTTGTPKGSLITRRAILNFAEWYAYETKMTSDDCYSLYTVCTFDIHTAAYYAPLIVGASMDVVPQEVRLDLNKLNDHFNK
ncbi:MAG: AMP-binding protein, partial [Bacilli bacterium]|nr:AMP-binding protein [Bacilli bacterium]